MSACATRPPCPVGALGLQLGLWRDYIVAIWPPRQKPKTVRRRVGVHRLVAGNLKDGVRLTVRFSLSEARRLGEIAAEDGCTISDVIRDALYEQYGIGEFEDAGSPVRSDMTRGQTTH